MLKLHRFFKTLLIILLSLATLNGIIMTYYMFDYYHLANLFLLVLSIVALLTYFTHYRGKH